MSDVVDVTDRSWEEVVERSEKPILAMFHSPTCPHCRAMMQYFEEYATEFKGKVKFVRINIMENSFTPERYGVMATPTFKFLCGGRPVQEMVGAAYPSPLKKMVVEGFSHGAECARLSTPIDYNVGYV
ncbi:MAG TPA: thioredoxin family protein [Methanothrix sp.]|nr:thioredoxin family protein [Methanothrix sp.]HPJ84049.1 thioredoxin family protein [Methanothrix sp.]HPR67511.1 thioredoxin family protein [Methanothrix sp.]